MAIDCGSAAHTEFVQEIGLFPPGVARAFLCYSCNQIRQQRRGKFLPALPIPSNPHDQYRTFGELTRGDKFISIPSPGDNSGHGGLRCTPYIFIKTDDQTSIRLLDGIPSTNPSSMPVIQVI